MFGGRDQAAAFGEMVLGRNLAILEFEGDYAFVSAGGRDDQGNYVSGPRGGILLVEDVSAQDLQVSPENPTNAL